MRIKVTQDHIRKGVGGNSQSCPIALAILEKYPGRVINVGCRFLTFGGRDWSMPPEMTGFIDLFDEGFAVDPFEFDLPIGD